VDGGDLFGDRRICRDARRQSLPVDAVAAANSNTMVDVQYGPVGPKWCSNALLEAIDEASAVNGRRIHMQLLESPRQR
ncbi:hypothetical protein ACC677_38640, partial [Rhizobium ruizarguesonis]